MQKISIELKNCYWIKKFEYDFDFSTSNIYSIYAPNGTMKTSFLKWFKDYIDENDAINPKDMITWEDWYIKLFDENNKEIDKKIIFPIESLNLDYKSDYSLLLVNKKFKEDYYNIYKNIEESKKKLILELNKLSWVKKDLIEKTILEDFSYNWNFFDFLNNIDLPKNDYENVKYSIIFSEKAKRLLENPQISSNIKDYQEEYEKTILKYSCFQLGGFTIYQADELFKEIKKSKYFQNTNNKLNLNNKISSLWLNPEIENEVDFRNFIEKVKNEISWNKNLLWIIKDISEWTKDVKEFQEHIEKFWNKFVWELNNKENFKKDLWNFYFSKIKDEIENLNKLYNNWIYKLEEISKQAEKDITIWDKTLETFKQRFDIDFEIDIENKTDVIIWRKIPSLIFRYNIDWKIYEKSKDELLWLNILSWWEKRIMYLLYIIFEIEVRKQKWWKNLLIIDDIIDSFDYKNKYSIIEYLYEIQENNNFKIIILSHNFDFYRNIQMRFNIKSWAILVANKLKNWEIKLINWSDLLNPINDFKTNFLKCEYKKISLIPVARNLIEYIFWNKDYLNENWEKYNYYMDLTQILHIKNNETSAEKLNEILDISFNKENEFNFSWDIIEKIIELSKEKVENYNKNNILKLEEKIVLSIWIRLKSEKFMIEKLKNNWQNIVNILSNIKWNQTRKLYEELKELNLLDENEEKILKSVLIITPELIHINSFMYEPLIDMWDFSLIELYKKVENL